MIFPQIPQVCYSFMKFLLWDAAEAAFVLTAQEGRGFHIIDLS